MAWGEGFNLSSTDLVFDGPDKTATGREILDWLCTATVCTNWTEYFQSVLPPTRLDWPRRVEFLWNLEIPALRDGGVPVSWGEYLSAAGVTGLEQIARAQTDFVWFRSGEWFNLDVPPEIEIQEGLPVQWLFRFWCINGKINEAIRLISQVVKAERARDDRWFVPVFSIDGIPNPEFRWWLAWAAEQKCTRS